MANEDYPINKYDKRHDVLHVFLGHHTFGDSSSEEEADDIYVTRNDDTDEIVGFTILDYKKKNAEIVKKMYPQYNFSIGYSEGYSED